MNLALWPVLVSFFPLSFSFLSAALSPPLFPNLKTAWKIRCWSHTKPKQPFTNQCGDMRWYFQALTFAVFWPQGSLVGLVFSHCTEDWRISMGGKCYSPHCWIVKQNFTCSLFYGGLFKNSTKELSCFSFCFPSLIAKTCWENNKIYIKHQGPLSLHWWWLRRSKASGMSFNPLRSVSLTKMDKMIHDSPTQGLPVEVV